MGAFLLAAGTKDMRHCLPHARVMIHQPHGYAGVCESGHFYNYSTVHIKEFLLEKKVVSISLSNIIDFICRAKLLT